MGYAIFRKGYKKPMTHVFKLKKEAVAVFKIGKITDPHISTSLKKIKTRGTFTLSRRVRKQLGL